MTQGSELAPALNWAGRTSRVDLSDAGTATAVLSCNYGDPGTDISSLAPPPYEVRVYRLREAPGAPRLRAVS